VQAPKPPQHLVLGAVGLENVRRSLAEKLEQIAAWEKTGMAADYPAA